jgi:hypothetical protein
VRTAGLVESSHCFTPNIAGFARNSTLTAANRPLPFRAVFWRSSDTHRNLTGRFIVPEGQTPPQSPKTHLSTQATDAKRQSKPSKPDLAVTSFFSLFLKTLLPWQLRGGHIFPATPEIIWIPASAHYMSQVLLYDCPSCTASCSVSQELVGLNVVCPNCTQEFTATFPASSADLQLPDAIPFFKSGKLEILKNQLNKLTSDGELSKSDEIALTRAALMLGLEKCFQGQD